RSPGNGYDTGTAIVLDAAGNAYVAGYTQSMDLPTTPDAFQPSLDFGTCDVQDTACGDGFIAKISAGAPGVTPAVNLTVDGRATARGRAALRPARSSPSAFPPRARGARPPPPPPPAGRPRVHPRASSSPWSPPTPRRAGTNPGCSARTPGRPCRSRSRGPSP